MMVSDGKLPMILLMFSDALLFVELSLISLVMFSANTLSNLLAFHCLLPHYFYTGNSSGTETRYDL